MFVGTVPNKGNVRLTRKRTDSSPTSTCPAKGLRTTEPRKNFGSFVPPGAVCAHGEIVLHAFFMFGQNFELPSLQEKGPSWIFQGYRDVKT